MLDLKYLMVYFRRLLDEYLMQQKAGYMREEECSPSVISFHFHFYVISYSPEQSSTVRPLWMMGLSVASRSPGGLSSHSQGCYKYMTFNNISLIPIARAHWRL